MIARGARWWGTLLALALALPGGTLQVAYGMDQVRLETHADDAALKYGVSGRGVTIAILDRGIDWSHPDFIKPDGTTRIKWLLDMSGQTLCDRANPSPVEYTEAQINEALAGRRPALNTRDAVGHGTATAGLAAGNGRAFAGGKYQGMAPQADLIIAKILSDGAPAHDTQPAEARFQGCIDQALDWLDGKIGLLGQPAVGLINSGTQWGPIDGTSAVSRKLDQVFGTDRPGRVYVAPSGDEGGLPNHAGGSYADTADTIVRFDKASTQTSYLQLWYTDFAPAQVTVAFDDGTTVGPVGPDRSVSQAGISVRQYALGGEFYPWRSTSGDRAVWIEIVGHSGGGSVRLRGSRPGSGRFNLYGDVLGPGFTPVVSFSDHLVPGRLTDYAATQSAIVAGAHVVRTSYVDFDGVPHDVSREGATGALYSQSSAGPTRDGRLYGVDLTAPGHNVFTSLAQGSYWATFRFNQVQDGGGWYVRAGATSGSAPIVVGAIALLLERNPTLTATQVRAILTGSAVADNLTGATPNASWGYGKLDVLRALDALGDAPLPAASPTATRMPAPVLTPTLVQTPGQRPSVGVDVSADSVNHLLQVTLTAGDAGCPPSNRLQSVRFTHLANATVDVPGAGTITAPSMSPILLAGAPQNIRLTVRRTTEGQPTAVALAVADRCGEWPTFVGGGPQAF